MLKSLRVVVVGGLQDLGVSRSSLGTNWVFELIGTWLGLGLGHLGTKIFIQSYKEQKDIKVSNFFAES